MRQADNLIYCYWHSLHAVPDDDGAAARYAKINEELIAANKKRRFNVKLVIARDPSRIPAAYQLHKHGVPVRFQKTLLISDLRFSLFDETIIVIGMSETELGSDKPSRHGVPVSNYKLHAMLLRYFEKEWKEATTFKDYLCSIVTTKVLENPENPPKMIARQLGVELEDVEACLEHTPSAGDDAG